MTRIIVVVREPGRLKPDYSLPFEVPQVPAVGSYLSVNRPGDPEPYSEDLVVRQVWWRLHHPETEGFAGEPEKVGKVTEIFVECDVAEGPYSTDRWRASAVSARERGHSVEEFAVERFSVRQSDLGQSDD